jgi:hypothetical protein
MVTIQSQRRAYISDPPDQEIAWAIQAYRCHDQLRWCLGHLRKHYPDSRVVIINDGDELSFGSIAHDYRCDYVDGLHLFALESCDRYVGRLITSLMAGHEAYCFKIDPDTKVWRRFSRLPAFSAMFGTIETITEGSRDEVLGAPNIQGGCVGMTRDVVEALATSGVIGHDTCVADCQHTWARCDDMRRSVAGGAFCDDFILSWAADALDAPIVNADEIRSRWRLPVSNSHQRFAVTHPHKLVTPLHEV